MKAGRLGAMVAGWAILTACSTKAPTLPTRKVPPGTVVFQFTQKVVGPMELALDGVRIPVQQKAKGGKHLVIRGLAPGRHRFFLSSAREAFGPDQLELELGPEAGLFRVLFSTRFDAVLYGTPEPAPAAEGMPGVQAVLEP